MKEETFRTYFIGGLFIFGLGVFGLVLAIYAEHNLGMIITSIIIGIGIFFLFFGIGGLREGSLSKPEANK